MSGKTLKQLILFCLVFSTIFRQLCKIVLQPFFGKFFVLMKYFGTEVLFAEVRIFFQYTNVCICDNFMRPFASRSSNAFVTAVQYNYSACDLPFIFAKYEW